jgi:hypothetical protein
MKKIIYFLVAISIWSCHSDNKRPSTAMETGTTFIKASLDGDFKTAEMLLLPDAENNQLFNAYKQYYNRMPEDKKNHYQSAAYKINNYNDINDSTVIINYSNDYMNKPMEIKIIKSNSIWSVDFKYTYTGNLPIN